MINQTRLALRSVPPLQMDAREAIIEYASNYLEVVFLRKEVESDRENQTLQALDEMLTIEHAKLVLERFNGDVALAYRFLTNRISGGSGLAADPAR